MKRPKFKLERKITNKANNLIRNHKKTKMKQKEQQRREK